MCSAYRLPLEVLIWDAERTRAMLGLDPSHPFDQNPQLQGACWAVLERQPDRTEEHGPSRLAFLHVQCEAVWLFWNLWVRVRRPAPFGILIQDHGYGGNWTEFGQAGALHQLAVQSGRLPQWLLSTPNSSWPDYRQSTEPTPRRSVPLPSALEMGEDAVTGGRALYAKEAQSATDDGPTALELIDLIRGIAAQDTPESQALCPNPTLTSLASPYSPRRLYFAYGSNMNPAQFHQRCPGSDLLGPATLRSHCWYITDRGVASVEADPDRQVHGILARLTEDDERRLDTFEGVSLGLYRREFATVHVEDGRPVTALIYISNDTGVGIPRSGYLEGILSAALHHRLPEVVIAELASWGQKTSDQLRGHQEIRRETPTTFDSPEIPPGPVAEA